MFTRVRFLAAVAGLLGSAAPAFAWGHLCGGYHLHYRAHGPVTGAVPGVVTPGVVTPGLVTHGLVTQGLVTQGLVAPGFVTQGLVAPGLVTQGLVTQGVAPQGLVPQGVAPQGVQGVTAQDIAQLKASIESLKAEVSRIRVTNDRLFAEVQAIRKGLKFPDPAPATTGTSGRINTAADDPSIPEETSRRSSGSGVDLGALRRQVEARHAAAPAKAPVDLAALRRQVEERQATKAVSRPATPPTVVANAR